jgi:hypothetical protein
LTKNNRPRCLDLSRRAFKPHAALTPAAAWTRVSQAIEATPAAADGSKNASATSTRPSVALAEAGLLRAVAEHPNGHDTDAHDDDRDIPTSASLARSSRQSLMNGRFGRPGAVLHQRTGEATLNAGAVVGSVQDFSTPSAALRILFRVGRKLSDRARAKR